MMRKMHASEPDPRYDGVKTSRSKIFDDDEDSTSEDEAQGSEPGLRDEAQDPVVSDEEDDGYRGGQPFGKVVDEDDTITSDEDEDEDGDESGEDGTLSGLPKLSAVRDGDRQLADALRKTREQDREKGKAVTKQLVCFISLSHPFTAIYRCIHPVGDMGRSFRRTDSIAEVRCVRKLLAFGRSFYGREQALY